MENTLKLSIVTPNGPIFEGDVRSLVLPGIDGEFGVLPAHSSLVTALDVGVIEIVNTDSSINAIAVNWGHVKVNETSVDVLVDGAIPINSNDGSDISHSIKAAQELVNSVKDSDVSMATIEAKIATFS